MSAPGSAQRYRWYAAVVLMLVYSVCLVDRQIITILAGEIKHDLNVGDAEIGLLFGTVFAVFFAIFGIPLGRLADRKSRTALLALGLAGWSLMTALSGFARNLVQLGVARLGVGIGEACANPAAYSLLSDYFPRERRGTALALYASGVSIGLGLALWVGGAVVTAWNSYFAAGGAPLGLAGWQAAFLAVGVPGLLLSLVVFALREPQRGAADGPVAAQKRQDPGGGIWVEFASIVPPFTVFHLASLSPGRREWVRHALGIVLIGVGSVALAMLGNTLVPAAKLRVLFTVGGAAITTHTMQWTALGVCAYAVFSWAQSLRIRDRATFALTFGTPAVTSLIGAIGLNMFITYGIVTWCPLYARQRFGISLGEIGLKLGIVSTLTGLIGTNIGGVVCDYWRQRSERGRIYVILFSMVASLPAALCMLAATSVNGFVISYGTFGLLSTMWLGAAASTSQELVLPRMRGTSAALVSLSMTVVGMGLGPYFSGFVSDVSGQLRTGMLSVELALPVVAGLLIYAAHAIPAAERTLAQRAEMASRDVPR